MSARIWILALLGVGNSAWAQNNDIYNFYFQKGSAPQSVIQGGGGQMAAPASNPSAPPLAPSVVTSTPPAASTQTLESQVKVAATPEALPEVLRERPFEVFLGGTHVFDEIGTGTAYTFGGQYNFNRYLGGRLLFERLASDTTSYNSQLVNRDQDANLWGGQAALVFTPIHMDLLGHKLLKISALGGVLSARHYDGPADEQGLRKVGVHGHGFIGVSAGVDLNESFSVEASYAVLDAGKIGQANASAVFHF